MPVGLLDGTAGGSDGTEGAARRIAPQFVSLRVWLLVDFPGLEVEELLIADVFQHQRLLAVADDNPIALANLRLRHATPPGSDRIDPATRPSRLVVDQFSGEPTPQGRIQLLASSNRLAITCA